MKALVVLCLLLSTCIFHESSERKMNSKTPIDFNEIKKEIAWFIDKVKPESIEQGKYNVYTVKMFADENRYCVTIGFIQDSLFISYVNGFKYYMLLNDDLVLLEYSDDFRSKYEFDTKDIQPLLDKQIVGRKIFNEGAIVGTFPGYVCCYENGNILKMYYKNSDEIPFDKAIFKYTPSGELIQLDSSSLKKIIREKKKN